MAEMKKYKIERAGSVYLVLATEADAKKRKLQPYEEPEPVEAEAEAKAVEQTPSKGRRPANKAAQPADK